MTANIHIRRLVALVLGGCAGLSLTVSVLPLVLRTAGFGDELTLTRALASYWPHMALVWAAGGWAVVRAGSALVGGMVLAIAGAVTGTLLVGFALGPQPGALGAGALAGGVYGFLGGLILGRVLALPTDEGDEP